jgi:cytochrome P450
MGSVVSSSILALANYPELLKKAQAEIDQLLGAVRPGGDGERELTRLPDYEDRDQLPYITALTLESLRWKDPTPVGEQ